MEENKDLQPEEKKTTKSETTKKATTKQTTKKATSGIAKKTATKRTVKKEGTGTAKRVTSAKKITQTTKKVAEAPKKVVDKKETKLDVEEKKETIKTEEIELPRQKEKIEKVEIKEEQKEQPKTVETKQEAEKPKFKPAIKVEKKKKHTFLKIILVLVIIAIVLFLINFARNYIILNSLFEKQEALQDLTNYSYVIKNDGSDSSLEYYRKDNTIMLVRNADSGKVVIWSDKDRKETIFLNMRELTATVKNEEAMDSFYGPMTQGMIFNSDVLHRYDYQYWITSDTVNGRDCYKITWVSLGQTAWYDKEDGTLVKIMDKGQYETEYTDRKYNELTDEDMSRPNLMGFNVKSE